MLPPSILCLYPFAGAQVVEGSKDEVPEAKVEAGMEPGEPNRLPSEPTSLEGERRAESSQYCPGPLALGFLKVTVKFRLWMPPSVLLIYLPILTSNHLL